MFRFFQYRYWQLTNRVKQERDIIGCWTVEPSHLRRRSASHSDCSAVNILTVIIIMDHANTTDHETSSATQPPAKRARLNENDDEQIGNGARSIPVAGAEMRNEDGAKLSHQHEDEDDEDDDDEDDEEQVFVSPKAIYPFASVPSLGDFRHLSLQSLHMLLDHLSFPSLLVLRGICKSVQAWLDAEQQQATLFAHVRASNDLEREEEWRARLRQQQQQQQQEEMQRHARADPHDVFHARQPWSTTQLLQYQFVAEQMQVRDNVWHSSDRISIRIKAERWHGSRDGWVRRQQRRQIDADANADAVTSSSTTPIRLTLSHAFERQRDVWMSIMAQRKNEYDQQQQQQRAIKQQ